MVQRVYFHTMTAGFLAQLSTICLIASSLGAWAQTGHLPICLPHSHSHNDYRQREPLHKALDLGFVSVEADILWQADALFVGHDRHELHEGRLPLFEEQYLDPLWQRFKTHGGICRGELRFYLWIDIKYEGEAVCALLEEMIRPYEPMLFSHSHNPEGPVMLIISGDRPMQRLSAMERRYLHIDGRPHDLGQGYLAEDMPFVSAHYQQIIDLQKDGTLGPEAQQTLRTFVEACRHEGKSVRLWATPEVPQLWNQLLAAGVGLINTDSLKMLATELPHLLH